MPESFWKRGWKDWWSAGKGWFVRALGMGAIGALVAYFLGSRMLASYPSWVGGLVAGGAAALLWGVLTLVVSLLHAPGKIIKEKDASIESAKTMIKELEANRPRLSACLKEQDNALFLVVTNDGATTTVSGKITVAGDILEPPANAIAIWRGEEHRPKVKIRRGDHKEIVVAERRSRGPDHKSLFHWSVPYLLCGAPTWTRPKHGAFPTRYPGGEVNIPLVQGIRQRVSVRVLSDEPPIECTCTLIGSDIPPDDLEGIPWCPRSIAAHDSAQRKKETSAAALERLKSFDHELSDLMNVFRGMRDASKPPQPGDMRVFRGSVQEIIASAYELSEPHRYEALSLLQPFTDGELSALDIHAATLQEWQVKTQRYVLTQQQRSQPPPADPPSPKASA